MNFIFFMILMAIFIITLIFLITAKVKLVFNSDKSELNMTMLWIKPLIKAFVILEGSKPLLYLYIFNKMIFKKNLKGSTNKYKGKDLLEITNPQDIHLNIEYGFKDPFTTGITCGIINIASQFINIDSINQSPDFVSSKDYVYLDANANVNLGESLIKLIKSKSSH